MIGIDAKVLIAVGAESHPSHSQAVMAFERELAADEEIAVSLSVVAEFLHVITDARPLWQWPMQFIGFSTGVPKSFPSGLSQTMKPSNVG